MMDYYSGYSVSDIGYPMLSISNHDLFGSSTNGWDVTIDMDITPISAMILSTLANF
jgi:hypothetical protein